MSQKLERGLIVPCEKQMEQEDNGAFEFRTTTDIDSSRQECLPDYRLTDVGGDEEIDAWAGTIKASIDRVCHFIVVIRLEEVYVS